MELHLIRHGEVEESAHRLFGGSRLDHGLSARGHEQARQLADHVRLADYTAAYISPLQRAQLTAAPLLEGRSLTPATLDGLREMDFGGWTGLRWEQVQEKFGVSAFDWLDQLEHEGFPEGETADDLRARVGHCLHEIQAAHAEGTVAVVCHGGIIRVALALLLDMPLRKTAHFEVDYASLTWVTCGAKRGWRPRHELQLLNYAPWRGFSPGHHGK